MRTTAQRLSRVDVHRDSSPELAKGVKQKEPRKRARGPSPTVHLARKEPWDVNTEDQAQLPKV
ncbi:hypothetical protein KSP39_PZI019158 [Platanthera zijinensis]|uniref:Uncharacterized protein n=1 Tax=Platanthera zijinensis TaxID=2320716 RepID=A0AAP0B0W9_9ASPA